jgi:hypothetical protein
MEHEDYYEVIIDSPTYGYFNLLIDKDDYDKVKKYRWNINKCWNKNTNLTPHFYAGCIDRENNNSSLLIHRYIMSAPRNMVVDHINGNTLDNRKSNLRVVTQSQNRQNYKGVNPNNTSGHIGVTWDKTNNKWFAHIRVNWKQKNLGLYDNIEDAIDARRKGEEKYFTIHNEIQTEL